MKSWLRFYSRGKIIFPVFCKPDISLFILIQHKDAFKKPAYSAFDAILRKSYENGSLHLVNRKEQEDTASMALIVGETVLVLNISILGVLKLRFFSDGAGFCVQSLQFFYQVFLRL